MAYSLMGLFGVNMPIIYGEGKKAFRRLQEEILMRTNDQSFLAWRYAGSIGEKQLDSRDLSLCPVFAETPAYFPMRQAKVLKYLGPGNVRQHMIIKSNIGITIWAPVIDTLSDHLVFAELNCVIGFSNVWVPLWKTERQSYYRVNFPSVTLYTTSNLKSPWIEPSKLCLEEPVLASDSSIDFLSLNISNSTNSSMKPAVEKTVQETEAAVEVIFALLDGKQAVSKSAVHMYPPLPPNEENHLGALRLCHRGDGYYHGMVVFKLDSNAQNKTVSLFLAASMLQGDLYNYTCRVLLDLDESSSADLETVSKSELAKLCSDEDPSGFGYSKSSIWRHRDQNGKTIVELAIYDRVIIAKIMFDAPGRDNHLSASIIAAFEKSKEMKEVVSRASSMSMSRG
jgi:hypothetical protein